MQGSAGLGGFRGVPPRVFHRSLPAAEAVIREDRDWAHFVPMVIQVSQLI